MITSKKMNSFNQKRFMGKSEDVKPMDVGANSLFLELDTGKEYYFDGILWREKGSGEPVSPQGSVSITANGEYNVTQYQTANVNVPLNAQGNIEITENGENINVAPYATATVNVAGGGGMPYLTATIVNSVGELVYPSSEADFTLAIKEQYGCTLLLVSIDAEGSLTVPLLYQYDGLNNEYHIRVVYFYDDNINTNVAYTDLVNCTFYNPGFGAGYLKITDPSLPSSATITLTRSIV